MIVEICWNVGNLDEFTQLQLWMGFMDFIWFYGLSVSVNRAHKRIYNILQHLTWDGHVTATLQEPLSGWNPPKKGRIFRIPIDVNKNHQVGAEMAGLDRLGA
jgi:hypothetical protein